MVQEGQRGRRKSLDSFPSEELQLAGVLHLMHLLGTDEVLISRTSELLCLYLI